MNKFVKKNIFNDRFIQKCKLSKCFFAVPFKESDFKKFKYKTPLIFFSYFWQKYEDFRKDYIEKNNKPPNNQFSGAALGIILTYLFDREGILIDKMDEKPWSEEAKTPESSCNERCGALYKKGKLCKTNDKPIKYFILLKK